MRRIAVVLVLLFGLSATFSTVTFAAAGPSKIAYVNVGKVFDEYEKTKDSDKILGEKSAKKQAERDKLVDEIKRSKDELDLLSDKGKEEKQASIDEKIKKLQDFDKNTRDDLKRERDNLMRDILKEIDKVVSDIGQKDGYQLILNDRVLLYGSKELDMTDQILKKLNEGYKKK